MLSQAKIRFINQLSRKKIRQDQGCFIVEGNKGIKEGLEEGLTARELYVSDQSSIPFSDAEVITEKEMKKISQLTTPSDTLAFFNFSQFISLTAEPPDMPSTCVCTAPLKPMVHTSEFELLILGDIALGGGDFTVVSVSPFEFTVLVVVDSVTIGSTANAGVDSKNITKIERIYLFIVFSFD